uniref:Putative structural protein n=1 Tax=viral metagenome TaxID=1070528 RepID=A0A6M3L3N4_9ZZZZ
MIIDKGLLVSNSQRVNNDNANEVSENAVDLSVARNIAAGETLYAIINIEVAPTGTGTTQQFQVITATNNDLTTGAVVLIETPAIAKASLTVGKTIVLALPPLVISGGEQRYLGINYKGDNTFETTGTVSAFFGNGPQTNQ